MISEERFQGSEMNRRLVVLFISLVVLVLLIVLNSALFVVRNISVVSDCGEGWYDSEEIITTSNISIGRNIFTLSENKAVRNIELNNPYVRVISIERIFPSSINIHITLRIPVIAIKINGEDNYFITDWELNIVDVVSNSSLLYSNSTEIKGISVTVSGQARDLIGTKLTDNKLSPIAEIAQAAYAMGITDVGFKTFFKNIDLSKEHYAYIKTNSGVTMVIVTGTDLSILDQFQAVYSIYVSLDINDTQRNSGYYMIKTIQGVTGWVWSATDN